MFLVEATAGGESLGLWHYMCVLEIRQMRVTAEAWNDASRSGPICEIFFFLTRPVLQDEPDGEAPAMDWLPWKTCSSAVAVTKSLCEAVV